MNSDDRIPPGNTTGYGYYPVPNMVLNSGDVYCSTENIRWCQGRIRTIGTNSLSADTEIGGLSFRYGSFLPHTEKLPASAFSDTKVKWHSCLIGPRRTLYDDFPDLGNTGKSLERKSRLMKALYLKSTENQDPGTNQAPTGNETGKGKIDNQLTPW